MAETGFTIAGTGANNADAGDTAWSDPTNIETDDGNYAGAILKSSSTSQYLHATNFGFSIPAGDTIDEVQVRIQRSQAGGAGPITDHTVQLIKGGTRSGDNEADTGTGWPGSDTNVDYTPGGLWGLTLTESDVEASNFGVALRASNGAAFASALVDAIWINVVHSAGGGDVDITPPQGNLVLSATAPTVNQAFVRSPLQGNLALTTVAASIQEAIVRSPPQGNLALLGFAPTPNEDFVRAPPQGDLVLSGAAPTPNETFVRTVPQGNLVFSSEAPGALISISVAPAAGDLTLSSEAVTVGESFVREVPQGDLLLTGFAPATDDNVAVAPGAGDLTLSSVAATVGESFVREIPQGNLTFSTFVVQVDIGVPGVEQVSGGTTLSPEERRQREFNRRARAQREAMATLAMETAPAKRRIKRIFRAVAESDEPELIEAVLPFAPRLADTLALPPEEAIKFDLLVRDLPALEALHDAFLVAREQRIADDEEAALVILLSVT